MGKESTQKQCSGCLSVDRFLEPLREHIELYLSLLGEFIYDTNNTDNTVLCWECKALLRRACIFQKRIQHSQLIQHSLLTAKNPKTKLSQLSLTNVTINSYSAEVANTLELPLFKENKNDDIDVKEECNSGATVKEECLSESENNEHYEVLYEVFETSDDNIPKQEPVEHEEEEEEAIGSSTDSEYECGAPGPSTKKKLRTGIVRNNCVTTYSRQDFKTSEMQSNDNESRRGSQLQIIGDIMIEHDNNLMEVDDENPIMNHVQKPRQTFGVRLNKAPKTSAERAREFRARKALLKQQNNQQQEPDAIVEIATEDTSAGPSEDSQVPGPSEIRAIEKRAKSAEATRLWRERKKGVSESKKQAKTAAQRMREYRQRKKLAKKILLTQQSDQDSDANSTQVNQRAGPSNSISLELTRRNSQLQQRIEPSDRTGECRERSDINVESNNPSGKNESDLRDSTLKYITKHNNKALETSGKTYLVIHVQSAIDCGYEL